MKVKTLIEYLSKVNPEATVKIHDYDGDELLFVVARNNDADVVWFETEDDVDIKEEIMSRSADASENGIDELDYYLDMLETGITVDVVRRYLGEESAAHMEEFCKEHGLI